MTIPDNAANDTIDFVEIFSFFFLVISLAIIESTNINAHAINTNDIRSALASVLWCIFSITPAIPENTNAKIANNIHFFDIPFSSVGALPFISHNDAIIIKIPTICKIPIGSFQKIGPATDGMIIPYITQIEVVDIAPTLIAVMEIV